LVRELGGDCSEALDVKKVLDDGLAWRLRVEKPETVLGACLVASGWDKVDKVSVKGRRRANAIVVDGIYRNSTLLCVVDGLEGETKGMPDVRINCA
jgi:hypothetical protein